MARAKKNAEEWSGVRKFTRSSEEIELHIPLLRKMIALYDYGNALSYDEKFAAGLVGIAIALERYRPELNVKLSYWISFQIDCQIRMETRRVVTQRKFCPQSDSDELLFDPAEEPSETDAERAAREDSAEPLKETRHNKKSRRADGKTMWRIGLTVRHTPAIVFVHRFVI